MASYGRMSHVRFGCMKSEACNLSRLPQAAMQKRDAGTTDDITMMLLTLFVFEVSHS